MDILWNGNQKLEHFVTSVSAKHCPDSEPPSTGTAVGFQSQGCNKI